MVAEGGKGIFVLKDTEAGAKRRRELRGGGPGKRHCLEWLRLPEGLGKRVIWLGEKRGNLSDWTTQVWVRATGREVSLAEIAWLAGPTGGTRRIGREFFDDYAGRDKRAVLEGGVRGLIPDFDCLRLPGVAEGVREFYEQTGA